jgi:hypothetical protein
MVFDKAHIGKKGIAGITNAKRVMWVAKQNNANRSPGGVQRNNSTLKSFQRRGAYGRFKATNIDSDK